MLLLAAGCAQPPKPEPAAAAVSDTGPTEPDRVFVTLTLEQQKAMEVAVRNRLIDPESARFGDFIAGYNPDLPDTSLGVCGWVNGRNVYGGYTGEQPFIGFFTPEGAFDVTEIGGGDRDTEFVVSLCSIIGMELP
jgi:hypothetical protein